MDAWRHGGLGLEQESSLGARPSRAIAALPSYACRVAMPRQGGWEAVSAAGEEQLQFQELNGRVFCEGLGGTE